MHNSVFFGTFTNLCNHRRYLISQHFHQPPKEIPGPAAGSPPHPPPRPGLATVHRPDPRIPHPSWKWTPAARGLLSGFPGSSLSWRVSPGFAPFPGHQPMGLRPRTARASERSRGAPTALRPPESSSAPGSPAAGWTTGGGSRRAPGSGARGPSSALRPAPGSDWVFTVRGRLLSAVFTAPALSSLPPSAGPRPPHRPPPPQPCPNARLGEAGRPSARPSPGRSIPLRVSTSPAAGRHFRLTVAGAPPLPPLAAPDAPSEAAPPRPPPPAFGRTRQECGPGPGTWGTAWPGTAGVRARSRVARASSPFGAFPPRPRAV